MHATLPREPNDKIKWIWGQDIDFLNCTYSCWLYSGHWTKSHGATDC